MSCYSLQLRKSSSPPDRRGQLVGWLWVTWAGGSGVESLKPQCLKRSTPCRVYKTTVVSHSVPAPDITGRPGDPGHDISSPECIYRCWWEGLKPNEACLIPSIGDISVIPEIFIAQRRTRSKREAVREKASLREQTLHTGASTKAWVCELVWLYGWCVYVCVFVWTEIRL